MSLRVVFVCVENSNRSQMAEAFARVREDWEVPDPRELDPQPFRAVRDQIERRVRDLLDRLASVQSG